MGKRQKPSGDDARRKAFGARLAELLDDRSITVTDAAEVLDVTPGAVCNWKAGLRWPSNKHQFNLATLLGVTIGELHGERGAA